MLETQRESVPSNDDGELDTALAFLSFSRSSVLKKLKGLDDEQLRRRLVGSDTTLLGLVQHLEPRVQRACRDLTRARPTRGAHVRRPSIPGEARGQGRRRRHEAGEAP